MPGTPDERILTMRHVNTLTFREELLEEEEKSPVRRYRCPTIQISIENMNLMALADSGSQVSCLSEDYYEGNASAFENSLTLPIVATSVVGATGGRPVKLKKQIFVTLKIADLKCKAIFLIIPKLSKSCVLGIDILKPLGGIINLKEDTLTIQQEKQTTTIQMHEEEVSATNLCNLRGLDIHEELTVEEIQAKMESWKNMSEINKHRYKDMLWKYRRIFVTKPGLISCYHHHLTLVDGNPLCSRTYPIPYNYEKQADEQISSMIKWNIIQKSTSPFVSPLVITTKKDGKIRLCLDARKLNERLQADHEGTESMEVLFQRCHNKRVLSSLDMNMSFWQIPLHSDSKQYTAFLYKGKCYEYNVTPFGLKTSTSALVRGLERVLSGLDEFVISYVDDILIASENEDEHLIHLEKIFSRFEENNITLNFRKCEFSKFQTTFLGHIISAEGIKPDPEKIQAIRDFNTPKNKKQLQGFLGTVNFSAKFSKNISEAITPMLELVKKGVKWHWNEKHQAAFEKVKTLLSTEIMLHFPDYTQPYYLQTDASDYAIGAVLYQQDHEIIKIIACGSRTLRGSELNYFTTEKELLALIWALEKYHHFLWGATIIHRTDHMALTFLRSCKLISRRLTRWIMAIQDYQIQTEYCAGKENIIADAISRQTTAITESEEKNITINRLVKRADKSIKHNLLNIIEEQKKRF